MKKETSFTDKSQVILRNRSTLETVLLVTSLYSIFSTFKTSVHFFVKKYNC